MFKAGSRMSSDLLERHVSKTCLVANAVFQFCIHSFKGTYLHKLSWFMSVFEKYWWECCYHLAYIICSWPANCNVSLLCWFLVVITDQQSPAMSGRGAQKHNVFEANSKINLWRSEFALSNTFSGPCTQLEWPQGMSDMLAHVRALNPFSFINQPWLICTNCWIS